MNRIARTLFVAVKPCTRFVVAPRKFNFQHVSVVTRSFGGAAHHDDHHGDGPAHEGEPFLDVNEVTERILDVVRKFEKVDPSKVSPTAAFKDDLQLDSLDAVEVVMAIEEEFSIQIPDSEADNILSVADAIKYIANHPAARL